MVMFIALVALFVSGSVLARSPTLSNCPGITLQHDLNVDKYMGQWYENRKLDADFEGGATCVTVNYTRNGDFNIDAANSLISGKTGKPTVTPSYLRIPDLSDAARMKIRYDSMPPNVEADYYVLGTDYDSYAVVYTCFKQGPMVHQLAWLLTREQHPSQKVIDEALAVLRKNNVDITKLRETEWDKCETSNKSEKL